MANVSGQQAPMRRGVPGIETRKRRIRIEQGQQIGPGLLR
jgi:hypothetical protein